MCSCTFYNQENKTGFVAFNCPDIQFPVCTVSPFCSLPVLNFKFISFWISVHQFLNSTEKLSTHHILQFSMQFSSPTILQTSSRPDNNSRTSLMRFSFVKFFRIIVLPRPNLSVHPSRVLFANLKIHPKSFPVYFGDLLCILHLISLLRPNERENKSIWGHSFFVLKVIHVWSPHQVITASAEIFIWQIRNN